MGRQRPAIPGGGGLECKVPIATWALSRERLLVWGGVFLKGVFCVLF